MKILYIGSLGEFGSKLCNYLATYYQVTAENEVPSIYEADYKYIGTINSMEYPEEEYDTIILYDTNSMDLKYVNNRLNHLCKHGVKRVFLVEEHSIFRKRPFDRTIPEMLLDELNHTYGTKVMTISCSCVYGDLEMPKYIDDRVREITKKNTLTPLGSKDETCDCIYVEDVCKAIKLIIEGNHIGVSNRVEIQSSYPFTLYSLIETLKVHYKQAVVKEYSQSCNTICYESFQSEEWSPNGNFLSSIPYVLHIAEDTYTSLKQSKRNKTVNVAFKVMALVCLFVLVELYSNFITVASDLQFVDLRLLYVCSCSLLLDKRWGIISAGMCSIASIVQCLLNGYYWYVLFYHINNWIPITIYFVVAILMSEYREYLLSKMD